ncbi:MAG TPA: hypothetical protein VII99_06160 [Bacteroidia bacterium]
MPVRKDSAALYMIVTLNDGTVLKGKILNKVRRRTEFRDELLGNVTFYSKDVASMEELQPQEHYLITMMNGTTVQGKIVERKGGILVFETSEIGNVYIDISLIKTIRCIIPGKMRDGKYWFKTAVDAHYFIALSAIPLKPSEVFYQNSLLLFNSFDAGITKNFSCAGGVFFPTAAFVAPHFGFRIANGICAGGGLLFGMGIGKQRAGIGYGSLTFGNRVAHMTVGGGYSFFTYQKSVNHHLVTTTAYITTFNVSGMVRVAPKCAFITENWFAIDQGLEIYSGGLRLLGEKHSWDFGICSISISRRFSGNQFTLWPIPFVSYMKNL